MALATRCPHCQTTFRVAHDQLKLRAGIVRCGACREVFNGVQHLSRPDEEPPLPEKEIPLPKAELPLAAVATSAPADAHAAQFAHAVDFDLSLPALPTQPFSRHDSDLPRPLTADPTSNLPEQPGPEDLPIPAAPSGFTHPSHLEENQAEAAPEEEEDATPALSDLEEPAFLKRARRQQRWARRWKILMGMGSMILLGALLLQGVYFYRDPLAARYPILKPWLALACQKIDCGASLARQSEAISLESSELQTLSSNQNILSLTLLLRNRSAVTQAWPNLELTLNDGNEQALLRRVFVPREYLGPAQEVEKGFASDKEQTVKLYFTLTQLKASGYRVFLFYP